MSKAYPVRRGPKGNKVFLGLKDRRARRVLRDYPVQRALRVILGLAVRQGLKVRRVRKARQELAS